MTLLNLFLFKFLIIGDIHLRGTNPRARKDDFLATMLGKLRECFEITRMNQVDAILLVGDLFDLPDPSYAVLKQVKKLLREAPCPVCVVPGNHDIFGYNLATLDRTALDMLHDDGLLTILPSDCWVGGITNFVMSGIPCTVEMDKTPESYKGPVTTGEEAVPRIILAHGMAMPNPTPFGRHTLLEDIAKVTNGDIILTGDYHLGYPPTRIGDKLFYNPGALCRQSAGLAEMERTVKVGLLTIGGPNPEQWSIEEIPLKSARPADEVLDRSHLEAQAAKEEQLAQFITKIDSRIEGNTIDPEAILYRIAESEALDSRVVDRARVKVSEVRSSQVG